jgi:sugar phosphate isomerase/epimerase
LAVVPGGLGCLAPVAHGLGRLAATLGDWKDADEHFTRAIAVATRMGAPVLVARAQHAQARALLDSDAPGAAERAVALLSEVATTARRLGLDPLLSEPSDAR